MTRRIVHVFATFGAGGPQIRMTQIVRRMGPTWRPLCIRWVVVRTPRSVSCTR